MPPFHHAQPQRQGWGYSLFSGHPRKSN